MRTDDSQTRGSVDARRSPRILRRVRLRIESENGTSCDATTAVINIRGALILSPQSYPSEATIRIKNVDRGLARPFRVVWCGEPTGSLYKLGVELLAEDADFWGPAYQPDAPS